MQNLNEFCLTELSSLKIQQSMLVKCTMESFIFGVAYGLYFLSYKRKDLLYFCGRWRYVSWNAVLGHFASTVLVCGLIGGIFNLMLPALIGGVLSYISNTIGAVLMGFSIVCLLPQIERRFGWIEYEDERSLLGYVDK